MCVDVRYFSLTYMSDTLIFLAAGVLMDGNINVSGCRSNICKQTLVTGAWLILGMKMILVEISILSSSRSMALLTRIISLVSIGPDVTICCPAITVLRMKSTSGMLMMGQEDRDGS